MQPTDPAASRGSASRPPEPLSPDAQAALAAAGIPTVTDPDVLAGHCVDWSGRWSGPAVALVLPRTTAEVASVLAVARRFGLPVQVQGGNTGLVGGSVPDRPALLLVTTGLDVIHPVDLLERTVVVGAGVTAAALSERARAAGLRFGVDLAARDTATIGGMVATNAGGIGVIAHGMMRDQVRGITAVLGDGRVLRQVRRPRKDNTGLDVGGLLIGSEGTLGVITEVEVGLHSPPGATSVALLAVRDLAEAVGAARSVQAGTAVLAAEVVDGAGVGMAARALGVADPLPPGTAWMLLLEAADGGTGAGFEPVADQAVAVAVEAADRHRLWALRERQTEVRAAAGGADLVRLDVSLRLDRLDEAVAAIRALVATAGSGPGNPTPERGVDGAGAEEGSQGGGADAGPGPGPGGDARAPGPARPAVGFFGHALDGNLHVQLLGGGRALVRAVLELVAGLGGSISAEHGIGRQKVADLHLVRSPQEIAWMRQVKNSADPAGLLNPGVMLPAP